MFTLIPESDCKFCEFPHLAAGVYDPPELVKSHAIHLLEALDSRDPMWDEKVKVASEWAK